MRTSYSWCVDAPAPRVTHVGMLTTDAAHSSLTLCTHMVHCLAFTSPEDSSTGSLLYSKLLSVHHYKKWFFFCCSWIYSSNRSDRSRQCSISRSMLRNNANRKHGPLAQAISSLPPDIQHCWTVCLSNGIKKVNSIYCEPYVDCI